MLYLNLDISFTFCLSSVNLTLTSVVFECRYKTLLSNCRKNLTLTSVVFESKEQMGNEKYMSYLTLTSVVFEFY